MLHRVVGICAAASLLALPWPALAAEPPGAVHCYRNADPVKCFVGAARSRLARVADRDRRADAIGEMLYALSATGGRDDAILKEAGELAASPAVRPVKQMDLLYALDLYASVTEHGADQSYLAALRRFAALEKQLRGDALVELYGNACSIIAWDDPLRERWLRFAQSVCTAEKLRAAKPEGIAYQALVLAMMPVAMALEGNRQGFARSASAGLSWLAALDKRAARSRKAADRNFSAYVGVLMHTMDSLSLDLLDEPEAAGDRIDAAVILLRRLEARVGISDFNTSLRRQIIDSLFSMGRDAEAKRMLRQLLVRVDADPRGSRIGFPEQAAILLQAARLEHEERLEREQDCSPQRIQA